MATPSLTWFWEEVTFVRTTREQAADQPSTLTAGSDRADVADMLLVACARTKLEAPTLACRLYTSALFRNSRAYAERLGLPWFILSAEHGLVTPDQLLAPYDRYLPDTPDSYRAAWGGWVAEGLDLLAGPLAGRVIEVHAGAVYAKAVAPHLIAKRADLVEPLRGMTIGARLHWYDSHRDVSRPPDVPGIAVDSLVDRLSSWEGASTPAEFLTARGARLKVPGLYGWWVDDSGAADLSRGLELPLPPGLIYAGLAGAGRKIQGKLDR